jgi:predicted DNA-binding protein
MAHTKATFTLDGDTVARLRRTAERLHKPQSQVVREAIYDYSERMGRLSERERLRMLKILREIIQKPPTRPIVEVEDELKGIRRARRQGGRRSATDR